MENTKDTEYKKLILDSLAKVTKKCRKDLQKSQYIFSMEYGFSSCTISRMERGLNDPQLTTFVKYAHSYNLKGWQLLKQIEEQLPEDFSLIDP